MSGILVDSSEHYYLSFLPGDLVTAARKRYSEGQRSYHVWRHVQEIFALLEEVDEYVACLPGVVVASVFHDVVYQPKRRDNEARSVALMRKMWRKTMDAYWLERAETMILATADHKLPEGEDSSSDTAYFLDMDLAILGAEPQRYAEYTEQIRQEYRHLQQAEYSAGRVAVLQKFSSRTQLFYTPWGQRRFASQAAENIRTELARLSR